MYTIFFPFYCNALDNLRISAEATNCNTDATSDVTNMCVSIFWSGLGLTERILCGFHIYTHHFMTYVKTTQFLYLITSNF
jgi:hypothetical protein